MGKKWLNMNGREFENHKINAKEIVKPLIISISIIILLTILFNIFTRFPKNLKITLDKCVNMRYNYSKRNNNKCEQPKGADISQWPA